MNMKQSWKCAVFVIGVYVGFVARAHGGVDPAEFEGEYKLRETVAGYCFDDMRIYADSTGEDITDMRVGHYFYPNVNAGPMSYDDQYERAQYESYTTDDYELIHRSEYYDKLLHEHGIRDYHTKLYPNGTLRVTSVEGAPEIRFKTECVYIRISGENSENNDR